MEYCSKLSHFIGRLASSLTRGFLFLPGTMSGKAKTSGVSRSAVGDGGGGAGGRGDSEPKTKKQRLSVAAGSEKSVETDEELYQKAVSLVFGGELYSKLLQYAGPEGIAHLRDDRKWRKAMDELPVDDRKGLNLPVVERPDDVDLTLLRQLLTEPASTAHAGRKSGCWTLSELGWKILVRSPLTSNAVIRDMINSGNDKLLDESVVERRGNSADILADLVRHGKPEFLWRISRHPSATCEILSTTLMRLPHSLLSPYDIRTALENIAKHENTGELDLDFLSAHENSSVRTCVARNRATPIYLLRKLSTDPDVYVRSAVACNPKTPRDILISLSIDPSDYVRAAVAENSSAGLDLLVKLALDDDPDVLETLACYQEKKHFDLIFDEARMSHRSIIARYSHSTSALERLVGMDDKRYDHIVACNPNTSKEVLARLATSDDDSVREEVAGNKNASAATLELLSNDDACKSQVASNESTPIRVLEALAKDDDIHIVHIVAENESATLEILRGIISSNPPDSVPEEVFQNESLPLADAVDFAAAVLEKDIELRVSLEHSLFRRLEDEKDLLPVSLVVALSKKDRLFFQRRAASCSNLPVKDILRMSRDKGIDQEVYDELEINPLLQVAVDKLYHLLSSGGVGNDDLFDKGEKWW